ncbi:MAG: copper resistance protein CopC [Mycobacterium sp.]
MLMTAVAVVILSLVAAPSAVAHAVRIATDPAVDAVLDTGPTRVSATFNEALQTGFAAMTVVGPDGNLWSMGDTAVSGAIASVAVRPLGPAGTYTVNYRVTSADGHVVSGSWPIHLRTPGTGTPGPPASAPATGAGHILWGPLLAVAAAIIGVAAVWFVRRRP